MTVRRTGAPSAPALLLVAHGTREPAGPPAIQRLAGAVARRLEGVPVHVGYVDVHGPSVREVLADVPGPVVALPAFLASGYHVRTDLPAQIEAAQAEAGGRGAEVHLADALGPAPEVADAMADRLAEAGWRRGDRVLFSAAGSSDARALADVRAAARLLGLRCGQPITPSYVTTAQPSTAELCGRRPVFVAPYLLAPGLFHRALGELPRATVADPVGAHPRVVELVVRRYRTAAPRARTARAR